MGEVEGSDDRSRSGGDSERSVGVRNGGDCSRAPVRGGGNGAIGSDGDVGGGVGTGSHGGGSDVGVGEEAGYVGGGGIGLVLVIVLILVLLGRL